MRMNILSLVCECKFAFVWTNYSSITQMWAHKYPYFSQAQDVDTNILSSAKVSNFKCTCIIYWWGLLTLNKHFILFFLVEILLRASVPLVQSRFRILLKNMPRWGLVCGDQHWLSSLWYRWQWLSCIFRKTSIALYVKYLNTANFLSLCGSFIVSLSNISCYLCLYVEIGISHGERSFFMDWAPCVSFQNGKRCRKGLTVFFMFRIFFPYDWRFINIFLINYGPIKNCFLSFDVIFECTDDSFACDFLVWSASFFISRFP